VARFTPTVDGTTAWATPPTTCSQNGSTGSKLRSTAADDWYSLAQPRASLRLGDRPTEDEPGLGVLSLGGSFGEGLTDDGEGDARPVSLASEHPHQPSCRSIVV
jgi:hypothetical protein